MKTRLSLPLIGLCIFTFLPRAAALGHASYVETVKTKDSFAIVQDGLAADLWVDAGDFPGVLRAAGDLRKDVARVTGRTPAMAQAGTAPGRTPLSLEPLAKVL